MKDKEEILYRLKYINHQLNTRGIYDEPISRTMYAYLQIEKEVLEWVLKGDDI